MSTTLEGSHGHPRFPFPSDAVSLLLLLLPVPLPLTAAGTGTAAFADAAVAAAGATQLYYMLVLLLEGSAQRLLEHAGDGKGLLRWRRLVAEYEPATAGRETSLLLEVWTSSR